MTILCTRVRIDKTKPRWKNVPAPTRNAVISFFGPSQQITVGGHLAVAIDNIVFCASNNSAAHGGETDSTSNTDRTKRRKFASRAPPRKIVSAEKTADRYVDAFTVSNKYLMTIVKVLADR